MRLADIDTVQQLQSRLAHADALIAAFQKVLGATVPCYASSGTTEYGRNNASVALPPVPKEIAVSAAQRERSKIVAELQQLGVSVD